MFDFAENYIALEGIDGSGKTTISSCLEGIINFDVDFFHDPDSKTIFGQFVRKVIKDDHDTYLSTLLYAASSISKQSKIELNVSNRRYISDRSAISTYVYSLPLGFKYLSYVHTSYLYPKTIIYLKIDAETAFNRLRNRGDENISKNKLIQLLHNYDIVLKKFESYGASIIYIDASQDLKYVERDILVEIEKCN